MPNRNNRILKYLIALTVFTAALQIPVAVSASTTARFWTMHTFSEMYYSSGDSASDDHNSDSDGQNEDMRDKPPVDDYYDIEPYGGGYPQYDDTIIYDDPPPFEYDDPPRSYDWSSDMVLEVQINRREEGLNMEGRIPIIDEVFGGSARSLNNTIDEAVMARIRSAKDARAKNITFDYEIYSDSNMVSVIIITKVTSATSKTEFDSVNFDPSDGSLMDLADAVGFDVSPLVEKIINERIRRDPERYNVTFDTSNVSENPFYREDDEVVILFDDFKLSSSAGGDNELTLDLDKINRIEIERSDYRINRDYNLKMVPLKIICEGLGYEADWVEEDGKVEIYLDEELVSDLEPGVNDYVEHGRRRRTLETAPELYRDTVYVPISFFDQILSWITYTVDRDDNITFYSYDD